MPRSWEYTPRRHWLMQCMMWAVLCGTLGVAYAVSHTLSVPSGQEVRVGPIALRLPDGFILDNNPEADVQARDPKRRLLIAKLVPAGRNDRELFDQSDPIDFRGLSRTGRMSIVQRKLSGPEGESLQLMFVASVGLPAFQQRIVIELIVIEEDGSDMTTDRNLIQKIANSVTLTGSPMTPRQRGSSKDTVVLQSFPTRGAKS